MFALSSEMASGMDLTEDGVATRTGEEDEVLESLLIALSDGGGVADDVLAWSRSFMSR